MGPFILIISILFGIPLLIPAIIGLYLIFRPGRLSKFMGWFAFKPVLATPLFLLIYIFGIANNDSPARYLSLLPGVVITLLLLGFYRDFFKGQTSRLAFSLLVLDLLRWGSAFVCMIFIDYTFCLGPTCQGSIWGPLFLLFTMAFPTLYAIAALILNIYTMRKSPVANTAEAA